MDGEEKTRKKIKTLQELRNSQILVKFWTCFKSVTSDGGTNQLVYIMKCSKGGFHPLINWLHKNNKLLFWSLLATCAEEKK